jgi:hypothetical protein
MKLNQSAEENLKQNPQYQVAVAAKIPRQEKHPCT